MAGGNLAAVAVASFGQLFDSAFAASCTIMPIAVSILSRLVCMLPIGSMASISGFVHCMPICAGSVAADAVSFCMSIGMFVWMAICVSVCMSISVSIYRTIRCMAILLQVLAGSYGLFSVRCGISLGKDLECIQNGSIPCASAAAPHLHESMTLHM